MKKRRRRKKSTFAPDQFLPKQVLSMSDLESTSAEEYEYVEEETKEMEEEQSAQSALPAKAEMEEQDIRAKLEEFSIDEELMELGEPDIEIPVEHTIITEETIQEPAESPTKEKATEDVFDLGELIEPGEALKGVGTFADIEQIGIEGIETVFLKEKVEELKFGEMAKPTAVEEERTESERPVEEELIEKVSLDIFAVPSADLKDMFKEEDIQEDVFSRLTEIQEEEKMPIKGEVDEIVEAVANEKIEEEKAPEEIEIREIKPSGKADQLLTALENFMDSKEQEFEEAPTPKQETMLEAKILTEVEQGTELKEEVEGASDAVSKIEVTAKTEKVEELVAPAEQKIAEAEEPQALVEEEKLEQPKASAEVALVEEVKVQIEEGRIEEPKAEEKIELVVEPEVPEKVMESVLREKLEIEKKGEPLVADEVAAQEEFKDVIMEPVEEILVGEVEKETPTQELHFEKAKGAPPEPGKEKLDMTVLPLGQSEILEEAISFEEDRISGELSFKGEVIDDLVVVYRKPRKAEDFLKEIQRIEEKPPVSAPEPKKETFVEVPVKEPTVASEKIQKSEIPTQAMKAEYKEVLREEKEVPAEPSIEAPSKEEDLVEVTTETLLEEKPEAEPVVAELIASKIEEKEKVQSSQAISEAIQEALAVEEEIGEKLEAIAKKGKEWSEEIEPEKELEILSEIPYEEALREGEQFAEIPPAEEEKVAEEIEQVSEATLPPSGVEKSEEALRLYAQVDQKITTEIDLIKSQIDEILSRIQILEQLKEKLYGSIPELKKFIESLPKAVPVIPTVRPSIEAGIEELAEIPEIEVPELQEEVEIAPKEKRAIKKEVDDLLEGISKVPIDKEIGYLGKLIRTIPVLFFLKPRFAEVIGRGDLQYKTLVGFYRIATRFLQEELSKKEQEVEQIRKEFQKYKKEASRLGFALQQKVKEPVVTEVEKPTESEMFLLREELKKKDKIIAEMENQMERLRNDFTNMRGRQQKEIDLQVTRYKEEIVLKVLGVVDNLERAIGYSRAIVQNEGVIKGFEMTLDGLLSILHGQGLEDIPAKGKRFDPNYHEALMYEETLNTPDGMVMEELRKGYMIGSKVIRPAQVKVARNPQAVFEATEPIFEKMAGTEPTAVAGESAKGFLEDGEKIKVEKKEEETGPVQKTSEKGYTLTAFFGADLDRLSQSWDNNE